MFPTIEIIYNSILNVKYSWGTERVIIGFRSNRKMTHSGKRGFRRILGSWFSHKIFNWTSPFSRSFPSFFFLVLSGAGVGSRADLHHSGCYCLVSLCRRVLTYHTCWGGSNRGHRDNSDKRVEPRTRFGIPRHNQKIKSIEFNVIVGINKKIETTLQTSEK